MNLLYSTMQTLYSGQTHGKESSFYKKEVILQLARDFKTQNVWETILSSGKI